jgi:hypothetical protein
MFNTIKLDMKIIDELIDEISNGNSKLTDILIKTKVLAFKLKNETLKNWIDNELNGYVSDELPEYRKLKCLVIGTMSNGFQRANNYPIPLTGIDKEIAEGLTSVSIYQSISTLDQFISDNQGSKMGNHVPSDICSYISKSLGNGYVIEYARQQLDKVQITQVLTAIKTKLLDFLLNLNEEIGEDNIDNFTKGIENEKVGGLFNSTVFGNNATIIIGNNNNQNVKNISKGNFSELKRALETNGVSESEILELQTIIDDDNFNFEKHEFGDKVKAWISKMLLATMSGVWNIGIGAAGNLLADSVKKYYGWE